jgi:HK97 family phage major capsid protein
LQSLNKKAMELDGKASKAIDYSDASALYKTEVVANDILQEYTNVGRLGALVNKVDILGATQWKQVVETAGVGFRPVGVGETKQEDQPVWTPVTILPKEHALIVVWYDAIARETPIAVYNQLVKYIAKEYAKLEDKIVISFAGVTTGGGDVFAATGLFPILQTDGTRTINVADFTAANIQAGMGRTYGLIESDEQLTIVSNRKTWGRVATTVDADGRNVFTVVGQQIQAGALGTFNVVISQEVPDGVLLIGAYDDYTLATRGGMETLFSREATVGSINLFEDDASAIRACVDIAGKPVRIKSFVLVDFVPAVS